jgi:hypothetical protein
MFIEFELTLASQFWIASFIGFGLYSYSLRLFGEQKTTRAILWTEISVFVRTCPLFHWELFTKGPLRTAPGNGECISFVSVLIRIEVFNTITSTTRWSLNRPSDCLAHLSLVLGWNYTWRERIVNCLGNCSMPFIREKTPVICTWNWNQIELTPRDSRCKPIIPKCWHLLDGSSRDSNLVDSASSIRLSQRLSHACLSINDFILWNCEWLIISVIVYLMVLATWITVVILELIHASSLDFLKRCIY